MRTYGVQFNSTSLLVEFDFWRILVLNFLEDADSIRIDCWNEEEVIKELLPLSKEVDRDSYRDMTIFTFNINENVINEIIYNGFNKNKRLKWFSLFLQREEEILFFSGHYGTELSMDNITSEEVKWVKYVVPKTFSFHSWISKKKEV
ncbi:hypothetical protein [Clostridium sp. Marseille-QA1073]